VLRDAGARATDEAESSRSGEIAIYSEKLILANLEEFERREKWCPVYHSLAQVEEFKAYINSIVRVEENSKNSYYELTRELTAQRAKDIRRWIENEQVLCMLDNKYFESRYAFVCDEKGDIFQFKNRLGQTVIDNVTAEAEDEHRSNELLVLKARQQGLTTKVAIMFVQAILFTPHTQAVMGSVIDAKSELITRIIETCIARIPFWLRPQRTTDKKNMIEFLNGSVMSIQSGNQATGIAQGWTPTRVHISEIGDIPNPKKSIEEGLLHATHSTYKLSLILEGTGNGNTGWLADKWRSAKEKWPLGQSRLRPIFIPWPMTPELFPTKDFIRAHPVPGGFTPLDVTRKHVRRCEMFVNDTDYLRKVAGKNWRMPVEQQWYWQWNYEQNVDSHTTKVWFAQKPADDYEALQGANDLVFDSIVIDTSDRDRNRDFQAYAITGESVDDGFEPDDSEIDYDKERIRVAWNSHRGQRFEWVMVPLKPFDEDDERRSLDRILIFEPPNMAPGHEGDAQDYSIGIDTADGLGHDDEDRSVCSISRSMKGENFDIQVAEFTSNRVNAPQMVAFAACLAAYYGEKTIDQRGCKFAIEQRERPGDDCQLQLKLMGFSFHHIDIRYDNKHVKENQGNKEGIYMHGWFRPMLMQRFTDAVMNGWYKPQSKYLIQELKELERKVAKNGKSRLEHQSGKHDDRVLAAAHSYWTRHALDVLAERSQKRYAPPTAKKPEVDYDWNRDSELVIGDMTA
jgi:hypothetical protein